jgi:hypothetical protein
MSIPPPNALVTSAPRPDGGGDREPCHHATVPVKSGEHRLCREQQPVGEFPTLRLAQKAAEQATD